MSTTLATMAEALIEFILNLLRDPEAASEFDENPEAALSSRGLNNLRPEDVCAVAPVIVDKPGVIIKPVPVAPPAGPQPPVVREIEKITQNFTWVDDRDTVVDQSVNQNIWAHGDVIQEFDNEAAVAVGDDSIAAGEDVDIDNTLDQSTNITSDSGDIGIGNDTTVTIAEDSYNNTTDNSVDTTTEVEVELEDSANTTTTTTTDETTTTTNTAAQVNIVEDNVGVADIDSSDSDAAVFEEATVVDEPMDDDI